MDMLALVQEAGSTGFSSRQTSLRLRSMVVCLSSDSPGSELPIWEAGMVDVAVKAEMENNCLYGILTGQLAASVFSSKRNGWEPVIEPCRFAAEAAVTLKRYKTIPLSTILYTTGVFQLLAMIASLNDSQYSGNY